MKKILIGIQARSTSERLPGKALAILHKKPVLSWVLNACQDSVNYIRRKKKGQIHAEVAILCPYGDEISRYYKSANIVEGDEQNVLSRYISAYKSENYDYIVRITGDCPFISSFNITGHIFKAMDSNIDYLSNVDEDVRTELDGRDIEVVSAKAWEWLIANAKTPEELEHVTLKIRQEKPSILKRGHFLSRLDLSDVKLSIDTAEELEDAQNRMTSFYIKKVRAEKDVGFENVFFA